MASSEPGKPVISWHWENVEAGVREILEQAKRIDYDFDRILAVARGGLIPAAMLAYRYRTETGKSISIRTVYVSSYEGQKQGKLRVENAASLDNWPTNDSGTLILDDICDSGATITELRRLIPAAKVAALVTKQDHLTDFYGDVGHPDFWYSFPWERSAFLNPENLVTPCVRTDA